MILMDLESNLGINLGETNLVTENGNERLGKQKLDLWIFSYFLQHNLKNL